MSYKPHAQKPRALNPEVQDVIIRAIEKGHYMPTACALAGITKQTYQYWQAKHDAGDEDARWLDDFFARLVRACAKAEDKALEKIVEGDEKWQASAWFIARRYPRRWSEKARATAVQATNPEPTTPTDEDGNTA